MKEKLLFVIIFITTMGYAQTIRYVKAGASGSGASWSSASGDLQNIINASATGDKVWVGAGTYQRATGQSFKMKEGVEIYGGFPATGNPAMNDRNFTLNTSTLLGNNASVVANDEGGFISAASKLDGFTITGGSQTPIGGGIKNINVSAIFQNLIITGNTANSGGGINNFAGSPVFINVLVHHNNAIGSDEDSGRGGGIFNYSGNPKFINCVIADNTAQLIGGGMGAVVADAELSNTIVYGNNSPDNLQMVTIWDGSVIVKNCLIEGSGGSEMNYTINSWTFLYGPNLGGNLDQDPMFNPDYTLQPGSPCINKGKNSEYPAYGSSIDIAGGERIVQIIDMGIYEYQVPVPAILYVKAGGTGNGTSWANASGDLQGMVNRQTPGNQVWVAEGTYQPLIAGTYFRQRKGIAIYGGFPSSGNPGMQDRNFVDNETILKGNNEIVVGNFWPDTDPLNETAILDGFTIMPENEQVIRVGMYNDYASPTLNNIIFKNHKAGAMYSFNYSSPVMSDCLFKSNSSESSGGGMIIAYFSQPHLTNCIFEDNHAANNGAAMWLRDESSAILNDVIIRNNTSNLYGAITVGDSHVELYNVTFTGNEAGMGGSCLSTLRSTSVLRNVTLSYNINTSSISLLFESSSTMDNILIYKNISPNAGAGIFIAFESSAVITNSTITHNQTSYWAGGGAAVSDASTISFRNCILTQNIAGHPFAAPDFMRFTEGAAPGIATFKNCVVGRSGSSENWDATWTGTDLGNNLDTDPMFVDVIDDDYRVMRCSPVINAGSNSFYAAGAVPDLSGVITDFAGEPRFYQNGTVDIGAYEFQGGTEGVPQVYYVSAAANGNNTGNSWANAFNGLTEALRATCTGDEIWVAQGTYDAGEEQYFTMKNGVAIYGGFPNTGSANWEDRNWSQFPSILQGTTSSVIANICQEHEPLTNNAVLDGFTITDGKGVSLFGLPYGGGFYNEYASPTLRNLKITGNQAQAGGGIFNGELSAPQLVNVVISNNTTVSSGGGIYFTNGQSQIINSTIAGNTSGSAGTGGGIYLAGQNAAVFKNSIIYGNTDSTGAISNIANFLGSAAYQYSLIQGSGGSTAWNSALGTDAGNNIDANPQFETGYKIPLSSPAADKGSMALYPGSAGLLDLAANPRVFGPAIDMGAYEATNVLGTESMFGSQAIMLYPNPATTAISIALHNGEEVNAISIYDMTGKKVYYGGKGSSVIIDVENYASGVYTITITGTSGTYHCKFLKE